MLAATVMALIARPPKTIPNLHRIGTHDEKLRFSNPRIGNWRMIETRQECNII